MRWGLTLLYHLELKDLTIYLIITRHILISISPKCKTNGFQKAAWVGLFILKFILNPKNAETNLKTSLDKMLTKRLGSILISVLKTLTGSFKVPGSAVKRK